MSCPTLTAAHSLLLSPSRLQAQRDIIFELRRIAFDAESEPNASSGSIEKRKSMYTRDYKKLGFIVSSHPSPRRPPGVPGLTPAAALTSPGVWSAHALQNALHIFQMFSWFKQDHVEISSGCSEME